MLLPHETFASLGPASCFPSGRASPGGGDLGAIVEDKKQYGFLRRARQEAIAHDRLLERISYNPDTGVFICAKKIRGLVRIGGTVGSWNKKDGYLYTTVDCYRHTAQRLAWFYVHKKWPLGVMDHINGDRADNRICNLRDVSQNENLMNRKVATRRSITGVVGVRPHRWGFQALIRIPTAPGDKKSQKCLGTFPTVELAKAAYEAASAHYYPGIAQARNQ